MYDMIRDSDQSPSKYALLVWDMQYDIALRPANNKEIINNIGEVLKAARKSSIPVFYAQHTSRPLSDESPAFIKYRMRVTGKNNMDEVPEFAVKGTEGWKIIKALEPEAGEKVYEKRRPDAFIGTKFENDLRALSINTLVIVGVSTEIGVESTARHAFSLDFDVIVLENCVGSAFPELHLSSMKLMKRCFTVMNSAEIIQTWKHGSSE